MIVTIFLTLAFLLVLILKLFERPSHFPPGPKGIPLLGYLPFLPRTSQPIISAVPKLTLEYGSIVGLYLGPFQPVVIVTSLKAVKEALNNDDLDGRPDNKAVKSYTFGKNLGIVTTDGEFWREQRNFTKQKLKELILDRATIEGRTISEILSLIEDIKKQLQLNARGLVDFQDLLFVPVINVLWDSVCGVRFRQDGADEETTNVFKAAGEFNKKVSLSLFMFPLPNSIVRLFRLRPEEKICNPSEIMKPIQNYIKKTIIEHQEKRKRHEYSSQDFIDHYLDEAERKGEGSTFSVEQLAATLQDLFIAGTDTTSNQIGFALIHLIHRPDVQRKMQEELDEVCGDRFPSLSDRARLPFTQAVLLECNRLSPVSPNTLPHRALKDTYLQSFFIPKNSVLLIQLREESSGEPFWTDPEEFRPERYLKYSNGSYCFVKKETFLPFGGGKRMCLGETMGNAMYFLFVASLVKVFEFQPTPHEPPPTLEPHYSMITSYQGFKAKVTPRLTT